ncbi:hypothetical protein B0H19DRAFT_1272646 [Mycena capillaripes]|nr:hypothetical protein B0H19DRAFT_1272646 [Mycena capillaripes]
MLFVETVLVAAHIQWSVSHQDVPWIRAGVQRALPAMDRLARLEILIDSYGTEFILASRACRGVRLRQLSTNAVTKELLTYLASYFGLQALALVGVDAGREGFR